MSREDQDMDQLWVLIPIVAILAGSIKEWLKIRARQQQIGTYTREIEKTVSRLEAREQELLDRIQNLETIVVSQTWNAVHDKELSPAERELRVASTVRRELRPTESDEANRQRAEQLARRLQG
jgi:hypothetical protein